MFVQKRAHWNTPGHYLCLQVSGKKLSQHSEISVSISGNLFSLREKSVLISNSVSCKIWTGCHYANKSIFQVCVLAGFVNSFASDLRQPFLSTARASSRLSNQTSNLLGKQPPPACRSTGSFGKQSQILAFKPEANCLSLAKPEEKEPAPPTQLQSNYSWTRWHGASLAPTAVVLMRRLGCRLHIT